MKVSVEVEIVKHDSSKCAFCLKDTKCIYCFKKVKPEEAILIDAPFGVFHAHEKCFIDNALIPEHEDC